MEAISWTFLTRAARDLAQIPTSEVRGVANDLVQKALGHSSIARAMGATYRYVSPISTPLNIMKRKYRLENDPVAPTFASGSEYKKRRLSSKEID
jgi:hypothetical protein